MLTKVPEEYDMSAAPPRLSVVIPAHNVETLIDETLTSVLSQDVAELQVIVVDDGSTDGTAELLERWAVRDDRLEVISSGGVGGGSARNIGVAQARGRFLVFCDADDIVPRGAYRTLVDQLERTGSDIAAGRYLKFSASHTWDPTRTWPVYKSLVDATCLADSPSLIRGRACWNKMFRTEFWHEHSLSFPDAPRSNDIYPMTAAMARASTIDIVPDVVYLYRERPGARSMTAQATTFSGVLSYLDQELRCADELALEPGSTMPVVYARLLLQADLRVHLMRLISGLDGSLPTAEVDAGGREIADRVSRLIQALPPSSIPSLRPEEQAVFDTVRRGGLAELGGLNERGFVGATETLGDADHVLADWLTALRLQALHDGFADLPFVVLKDRILRPLEGLIDRADTSGAAAWSRLASSLPHLDDQDLTRFTTGERTLLSLAGDDERISVVASMRRPPAPTATPAARRNTFVVTVPELPAGVDAVITARHRDTRVGVALATADSGTSTTVRVSGDGLPHDGVWQLEMSLASGDLGVDRPVRSSRREEGWPVSRWHRVVATPILRAGDQVVVVRRRALPLRLTSKAVQRVTALVRSRVSRR